MTRERITGGVIGGGLGGIAFALVLQAAGTIERVGMLAGSAGTPIGWITLLVVSLLLGVIYALTFGRLPHTWARSALYGLLHGLIWWAVASLLAVPTWLDQSAAAIPVATLATLLGYLLYGLVVGLVTTAISPGHSAKPTVSA